MASFCGPIANQSEWQACALPEVLPNFEYGPPYSAETPEPGLPVVAEAYCRELHMDLPAPPPEMGPVYTADDGKLTVTVNADTVVVQAEPDGDGTLFSGFPSAPYLASCLLKSFEDEGVPAANVQIRVTGR